MFLVTIYFFKMSTVLEGKLNNNLSSIGGLFYKTLDEQPQKGSLFKGSLSTQGKNLSQFFVSFKCYYVDVYCLESEIMYYTYYVC